MRKIILASTSPRRQGILHRTGLHFVVEPPAYEENMALKLPPRELAKLLARGKAASVARRHKDAIVIGSDTIVVCAGKVIGKPRTAAEARKMLRLLSGRKNSVITGLAVIDTRSGRTVSRSSGGDVYLRKLSHQEIDAYVKSGEPMDKAAAYALQGRGAFFIKKIEGDCWGIVGLPVYVLGQILQSVGVDIFKK